jgi:topoisomerase-4 subunit B
MRDHFDHWLSAAPAMAEALLASIIARAEARLRKREDKQLKRQTATRRLRLPGKLAIAPATRRPAPKSSWSRAIRPAARPSRAANRETQAELPLRGKILNVASASVDKIAENQELSDLVRGSGVWGVGDSYREDSLRYERIIIMTDADVDGAHIASLLMTFFFRKIPKLVENGHLFLAMPPLYRISHGGTTFYARDDAHKEEILRARFRDNAKVEISRFKGLGEMPAVQLRETTMNPEKRTLLRVKVPNPESDDDASVEETARLVECLMGRKPELRFAYIQEHAKFVDNLDV